MSFKVVKLTVGKGKTEGDEKAARWIRQYYEIEIEIQDEHDIEIAKASAEGLIDGWLAPSQFRQSATQTEIQAYDMNKIKWTQAEGSKGSYERSGDVENPEFQALLKKLEAHNGKLTQNGFFLWKFSNSSVIGRKKRR